MKNRVLKKTKKKKKNRVVMELKMVFSQKKILPFIGMIMAIFAQVSNMVVSKEAMSKGINKYVILLYSNAISTLLFFISSFIIYRSDFPPLNVSIVSEFFFLAAIGSSTQICGYISIDYSSPALAASILNLVPAFTFILAIILRMEIVDWSRRSSQAKLLGTIVLISGAFVVTFYKGPPLMKIKLLAPQVKWILGGFFSLLEALFTASWFILQASILKKFPAGLIILSFLYLFNTIFSTAFSLIAITDRTAWIINLDIGLIAIIYSVVIGSIFRMSLITWCNSKAGPFYVSMFKPLAILFAAVMDVVFLGDVFCLRSLIGAVVIVIGFYVVMWGKAKEERKCEDFRVYNDDDVPFLLNRRDEI